MIGRQRVYLFLGVLAAMGLAAASSPAHAGVIAHWSFDAADINTDGANNILSAADDTGNHNATAVINGTGAGVTSGVGRFGEGADFTNATGAQATNNASFNIPQLTELAGAGDKDFTVSAWVKTTNTSSTAPILADWGNAPSGTNRFTYWFTLNSGSSQNRQRGQFRSRNDLNDGVNETNTDVAARQVGPNLADDQWHHVAWTWDKSTSTFRSYQEGELLDTFVATADLQDLLVSASTVGAIGRKADNNQYMAGSLDDIWVFDQAIGLGGIRGLFRSNEIPEPASALLAAFGGLALGVFGLRRQ
jgi:Concanavalin A-like lectin/glucanases superfamily